jgi:hypothetical protein
MWIPLDERVYVFIYLHREPGERWKYSCKVHHLWFFTPHWLLMFTHYKYKPTVLLCMGLTPLSARRALFQKEIFICCTCYWNNGEEQFKTKWLSVGSFNANRVEIHCAIHALFPVNFNENGPYTRDAQIPGARSPWRQYFKRCRLIFVDSQYGTWLHVTLMASRILMWLLRFWKICAPLYISYRKNNVLNKHYRS